MAEDSQADREIHEALYDGADVPVSFKDGRNEVVKVRKLPRNEFGAYALLVADEAEGAELAEAALYAGRDQNWAADLDEKSLDLVLEEGQRLNFTSFRRWYRRRVRMLDMVQEQAGLVSQAIEAMKNDPTLSRWLASTNGSSPRAGATPSSGPSARPS